MVAIISVMINVTTILIATAAPVVSSSSDSLSAPRMSIDVKHDNFMVNFYLIYTQ